MRSHESDPFERVRTAENAWNLRDIDAVVLGHRIDCQWRNRADFFWGREQIRLFITRKWRREIDFRTQTELWSWSGTRLSTRFSSEFHDDSGTWFRSYGNESWEYDAAGLIFRRLTSVNEHPIRPHERVLRWEAGIRPADYPSLTELGL